jgi:lysophospholipid acyltransferase
MPPPSPYKFAMVAVFKGFLFMGICMYLMAHVPTQQLYEPEYLTWGLWHRIAYQYLCAFTLRWKYYFAWSLSEASMIISGFGFSGWTKALPSEGPQPKWTRAKNVDILRVELPRSAVELPHHWNIHVGIWLRHYVYERLTKKGEKPGFMQLLAAQVTSAVWHVCSFPCPQIFHLLQLKKKISLFYLSNRMLGIWVEQGLYPGYILFFVNTAFMITGARGKHWTSV